jgi:hypothetical protein
LITRVIKKNLCKIHIFWFALLVKILQEMKLIVFFANLRRVAKLEAKKSQMTYNLK